jgi:hypothetical protein
MRKRRRRPVEERGFICTNVIGDSLAPSESSDAADPSRTPPYISLHPTTTTPTTTRIRTNTTAIIITTRRNRDETS